MNPQYTASETLERLLSALGHRGVTRAGERLLSDLTSDPTNKNVAGSAFPEADLADSRAEY